MLIGRGSPFAMFSSDAGMVYEGRDNWTAEDDRRLEREMELSLKRQCECNRIRQWEEGKALEKRKQDGYKNTTNRRYNPRYDDWREKEDYRAFNEMRHQFLKENGYSTTVYDCW